MILLKMKAKSSFSEDRSPRRCVSLEVGMEGILGGQAFVPDV